MSNAVFTARPARSCRCGSYADTIPFGAQAPETGTYRIVVTEHDDAFSGYHFEVNTAREDSIYA
ncbi:hypothetical protein C8039_15865 [Halogeometricum sp. wsp3]|nr:hypothetical protein C8039_15865 [Halogeometricum sp. wsp3]